MAPTNTYIERRGQLEDYFDRTALEAWRRLTSTEPVGRVRATVRAGRDRMRATLLSWLPQDLHGARVLDAGCGSGALSIAAAERGAQVTAIDLSPQLVRLAAERYHQHPSFGRIDFRSGDMLDAQLGRFDYVVSMDSLIHYRASDTVRALSGLATRTERAVLFTFAPRTRPLALMHAVGRLIPNRSHRAPAIEPVAPRYLATLIGSDPALEAFEIGRQERVSSGFYTSEAMELVRR
jgi:magnesium-protoporphyrin O-methyltransferase